MEESPSDEMKRINRNFLFYFFWGLATIIGLFIFVLLSTFEEIPFGFNNEIKIPTILIAVVYIAGLLIFAYFAFILYEWWDFDQYDELFRNIFSPKSKQTSNVSEETGEVVCPQCGTTLSGELCVCEYSRKDLK